ncbi:hypothetical protein L6164_035253 [Bauhinia variegata]|uniref:Uncharacterized protein n=1 Tax=Bauhinia variegata TaxID=167791 RepID=A0ACB9KY42_BAUVA|nr:hypothetical protein L6164_035253 [Bauhinia variegata]
MAAIFGLISDGGSVDWIFVLLRAIGWLLYQMISKRSIEVHNVRATNGPELASFMNDMEFNITTFVDLPNNPATAVGFEFNLTAMDNAKKHLIQPLFHEFLPGSVFRDRNQLQASLENSLDGLINTTLYINLLSAYIVEIDKENYGSCELPCRPWISECECRIKKLRNEDSILRRIRNRVKLKSIGAN